MIAGDDAHMPAGLLNEPGIVGGGGDDRLGVLVGVLEHLTKESLGGLYAAQRLTIRSRQHFTLGIDHLDGVGHREPGNDGGMARANSADNPVEEVRGRQTSGDVMDKDDAVVMAQRRKTCLHRGRPIHPSGHDIHPGVVREGAGDVATLVEMRTGGHDDDMRHVATTKGAPQCVSQQ
jgi:hypothetical protein